MAMTTKGKANTMNLSKQIVALLVAAMMALIAVLGALNTSTSVPRSTPCIKVTTLGTGTPERVTGPDSRAQSSTLVSYGIIGNGCSDENILFDMGGGALLRLNQAGLNVDDLDAIYVTHWHWDHMADLPEAFDSVWTRGLIFREAMSYPDVYAPEGFTGQRLMAAFGYGDAERGIRETAVLGQAGPPLVERFNSGSMVFESSDTLQELNSHGAVTVKVVNTEHVPLGAVSYQVVTPAGTVAVTGDTTDTKAVTKISLEADIVVSEIAIAVENLPPPVTATHILPTQLGARMIAVDRANGPEPAPTVFLTHFIPSGPDFFGVPLAEPISETDFVDRVKDPNRDGTVDYQGEVISGRDLSSMRLTNNGAVRLCEGQGARQVCRQLVKSN